MFQKHSLTVFFKILVLCKDELVICISEQSLSIPTGCTRMPVCVSLWPSPRIIDPDAGSVANSDHLQLSLQCGVCLRGQNSTVIAAESPSVHNDISTASTTHEHKRIFPQEASLRLATSHIHCDSIVVRAECGLECNNLKVITKNAGGRKLRVLYAHEITKCVGNEEVTNECERRKLCRREHLHTLPGQKLNKMLHTLFH